MDYYADDLALYANTSAKAGYLLHRAQQVAECNNIQRDVYKTDIYWFNQE